MSRVVYPPDSPYSSTPQTSWHIGRNVWRAVPPSPDDRLYTLLGRHQHRPDTLSDDLYNDPSYWWVFCVRNPFLRADPIWAFLPGARIWVPSSSRIQTLVG